MYDEKITLHREDADKTKQIIVEGDWTGYKLTFGAKSDKDLFTPLPIKLRNTLAGGTDEMEVSYDAESNTTAIRPYFLPAHTRGIIKLHNYYEVQAVHPGDSTDIHTIAGGVLYINPDVINDYNGVAVDPILYIPFPIDQLNDLEIPQKYQGGIRGITPGSLMGENYYNKLEVDGIASTLQDNTDAETLARSTADGTLQDNIDAETLARSTADGTLQDNIDAEALARSTADGDLQSAIGAKADLVDGKVPSSQLPSYTDEVIEAPDFASLPETGESGKIYVTLDTNIVYRWSGSAYVEVSASLALGSTPSTAHRGDHGAEAYAHSYAPHAPSNAQKNSDITKAEIEAKLTGEISSHSHASSGGLLPDGTVTGATTQAQAFTNGIVSPTITGGTGVSSKITYKSTTGAGTATAIAHQFVGGLNGATVIMTMLNNGDMGIGYTSSTAKLSVNGSISAGSSSRVATGSGVHVSYGGAFETNNGSTSIAYYMPTDPSDNYSSIIRNSYSDGQIKFNVSGGSAGGNITKMTITKDGKIGAGITSPTAIFHLGAGTATANTAPLKLTTGALNTTAEAGAIEYNNTFHFTNSDATRRHVVTAPNTTKVTAGAPYTNDGYVVINIGGTNFNVMTTAA